MLRIINYFIYILFQNLFKAADNIFIESEQILISFLTHSEIHPNLFLKVEY